MKPSFEKPSTRLLPSGFLLPSIHAWPAFFTPQPYLNNNAAALEQWTHLILSYARHCRLWHLRREDAEITGSEWNEVLRNERINRRLQSDYLSQIMAHLVARSQATYDPPNQTHTILLFWRTPEEWADVLYQWADTTGQLNTILTLYEITDPPVSSPLSGIPMSLLRHAITILTKSGRAQIIGVADGEGVRFLQRVGRQ
ncbi:ESCRT-II complex, vps25 subunit [Fistulina hepatica ATCC 64428]|uniref:ESCRT-II complex, vps25 subunit n=1 Tax=Fistulina hepatica ATCC 64428 TaxID=1128425 RepID=A0A0D7A7D2_9AGAR|nr:ESCRT-II complex, vps25 subunit [Fistulina hepatica ATCC 64428]